MYLGTRKHSLDAKSRLTLPADFRKQVGDQVCLVPLKDALYGFAPVEYEAWVNSFFENGERHFDPRSRVLPRMLSWSTWIRPVVWRSESSMQLSLALALASALITMSPSWVQETTSRFGTARSGTRGT